MGIVPVLKTEMDGGGVKGLGTRETSQVLRNEKVRSWSAGSMNARKTFDPPAQLAATGLFLKGVFHPTAQASKNSVFVLPSLLLLTQFYSSNLLLGIGNRIRKKDVLLLEV